MRTKLNSNGLKNLISRIVRESINEKMVDRFTPYTDKDREENFTPFTSKDTRTSFQRNPSYEKALKDAEERRKKKQAGITEEGFDRIVRETINKVLNEGKSYIPNAVYIVFDGTSHYAVYGFDVEDEIINNDAEVVKGPFAKWDENVEAMVESLNDEAFGVKYDKHYY